MFCPGDPGLARSSSAFLLATPLSSLCFALHSPSEVTPGYGTATPLHPPGAQKVVFAFLPFLYTPSPYKNVRFQKIKEKGSFWREKKYSFPKFLSQKNFTENLKDLEGISLFA